MKLTFISILLFSLSSFAKTKLECPLDSVDGDRKKVAHFFNMNPTEKVVICAPLSAFENDKLKTKFMTEFEAHLFRNDKWVRKVFSGSGTTPIRFEQRKKQLYEITHLNLQGKFHPLFKNKIGCEENKCKRVEKTCVFDQKKLDPMSPTEFESEKAIYTKASSKNQEITGSELAQMSLLALHGRKLAFDFFVNKSPTPLVIGSAADFYQNMKDLLMQMEREACLEVSNSEK